MSLGGGVGHPALGCVTGPDSVSVGPVGTDLGLLHSRAKLPVFTRVGAISKGDVRGTVLFFHVSPVLGSWLAHSGSSVSGAARKRTERGSEGVHSQEAKGLTCA